MPLKWSGIFRLPLCKANLSLSASRAQGKRKGFQKGEENRRLSSPFCVSYMRMAMRCTVSALMRAPRLRIKEGTDNQLRRFSTPLLDSPVFLAAPEALPCAQNKIRLVLSIHTALIADAAQVERYFAITALQSESFLERESGVREKKGISKGRGKPQVVLSLLRISLRVWRCTARQNLIT